MVCTMSPRKLAKNIHSIRNLKMCTVDEKTGSMEIEPRIQ